MDTSSRSESAMREDVAKWLQNNDSLKETLGNNRKVEKMPLIHPVVGRAALARQEIDDLNSPEVKYPGVDDGFFTGSGSNNTDVEIIPEMRPRRNDENDVDGEDGKRDVPEVNSGRPSVDGDHEGQPDSVDGRTDNSRGRPLYPADKTPHFPYAPGYGAGDAELGPTITDFDSIPDVNVYQHKKTLAQGMMDLALFSANANQLRYVLESSDRHPYFYPSLVMISMSLILQIVIGIGLIWNSRYNVKDNREICIANKINNYTVIGIFIVTSVNVFISAFGVANAAPTSAAAT